MKTKTYKIEITTDENGKETMIRTNSGFSIFELIGMLDLIRDEFFQIYKGEIKPDIIQRKVIID